jgi:hypothetical protein
MLCMVKSGLQILGVSDLDCKSKPAGNIDEKTAKTVNNVINKNLSNPTPVKH